MQIYGIPNFISMRFGFFALLLWLWRSKFSKFRLKHTDIKKKYTFPIDVRGQKQLFSVSSWLHSFVIRFVFAPKMFPFKAEAEGVKEDIGIKNLNS